MAICILVTLMDFAGQTRIGRMRYILGCVNILHPEGKPNMKFVTIKVATTDLGSLNLFNAYQVRFSRKC